MGPVLGEERGRGRRFWGKGDLAISRALSHGRKGQVLIRRWYGEGEGAHRTEQGKRRVRTHDIEKERGRLVAASRTVHIEGAEGGCDS